MDYVRLGRSDLKVSQIGLGGWQFGAREWGWGRDYGHDEVLATINRALEVGVNLIDTAEVYGGGKSEEIIGQALHGRRDDVVIATKVSPWHLRSGQVLRAANRSLRRLNIDCIDLYQVHWPNPLIPIGSTMKGMERLVRDGKVRHIGVSNFSANRLKSAQNALGESEIVSNQVKYNLLQRGVEKELLPYARDQGVSIIAYSPLAQGLLTGKYGSHNPPKRDVRIVNRLFSGRNLNAADRVIDMLRGIAATNRKTIAQVSLNWLINDAAVIAIPGAKNPLQVEENAGAAGWSIDDKSFAAVDEATRKFRPETIVSLLTMPVRTLRARFGKQQPHNRSRHFNLT
jgi:aryl-alcohol dehydrogenase-like predicted oxidoreductase